jgi:hypothetical protein
MKTRVSVPPEIIQQVSGIISQSLKEAEVSWEQLTQHQKSGFYTRWSKDQKIITLLGGYVDNIRGYIKDDIVRIWHKKEGEVEDVQERLEKVLPEIFNIEVIDIVEARKTKMECRLLLRLKGNTFLVAVGGQAVAWRTLLVRTMEWDLHSQRRLRGITHDRKPALVLFRAFGDTLGGRSDQNLVKQLAIRCGIELTILPPDQKRGSEVTEMLPLFAEQENG